MIKLLNVSKKYSDFIALKNINLTIKAGEFTAITGPSGSGKSTLMHLIGLLDLPSSGKILIENQDVSKLNDNQLSKLRSHFVGFIFQQFNLINKLTVLENVMLPTIYSSFTPQLSRSHALSLLERFGIADKATSYPNKLSGGQQQRVAIARALIMKPKLILADEPTGNLDSINTREIIDLLKKINNMGTTIVLVTHNKDVVNGLHNRVITLDSGQIISDQE
ncbi:MAG: ABC transporter ATP-binding protein, partial [Candidatus Amesbacteria bacterium]|nr:ABC transporter ATP-binding protein [Candidatus Amesbacteria bacterium]